MNSLVYDYFHLSGELWYILIYFAIFLLYFQSASLKAAPVSNDKTEITVMANVPEAKDIKDWEPVDFIGRRCWYRTSDLFRVKAFWTFSMLTSLY